MRYEDWRPLLFLVLSLALLLLASRESFGLDQADQAYLLPRLQQLRQQLESQRQNLKTLEESLQHTQALLTDSETTLTGLRDELANSRQQIETLQTKIAEAERLLTSSQEDLTAARGSLTTLSDTWKAEEKRLKGNVLLWQVIAGLVAVGGVCGIIFLR